MSKPDNRNSLNAEIRDSIVRDGRSYNELAKLSGVDVGNISRFARGERDITLATASSLCGVLGLELRPVRPAKRGKGA